VPTQDKPLPLLVGCDGFPETPLDEDSSRGMLMVRGQLPLTHQEEELVIQ
jgi:hypothetical protein